MQDNHLQSKREIADRVGVQESTLESILSMLLSKGYLEIEEKNMGHSKGCIGCPMSGGCISRNMTGDAYLITERGEKLLSRSFS